MMLALFYSGDFWSRITGRAVYVSFNSRELEVPATPPPGRGVTANTLSARARGAAGRPLGAASEAGASSRRPTTALARGPYSDAHPSSPRDLSAPVSVHAPAQDCRLPGARGRSPAAPLQRTRMCGSPFRRVGGRFFAEGRIRGL